MPGRSPPALLRQGPLLIAAGAFQDGVEPTNADY